MKRTIISIIIFLSFIVMNAQNSESPKSTDFHSTRYFIGSEPESEFGANVVNVGDFNADGFEDLAISADGANDGAGKVYLYFGGETSDMRPDVVFDAPTGSDDFGYIVSSAGDFNSDGFDDMVIVSRNYSTNNPTVTVYFGGPYFDTTPDVYLQNYWNSTSFGNDVASLGDINGDGIDDIGVISGNSVGLYFGSLNPAYTTEMSMSLNHSSDYIAYCGDVNGDGYNDILTSSPQEGLAMIYKGGPELGNDPNVFFDRTETNSQSYGYSISGGGDINGDGLADVVIGDMDANNYSGAAYVYLGSTDIFTSSNPRPADLIINGADENNQFGSVVAIVKDMNGDGFDELAVGGSNMNFMNVYYGKTHPDNTVSQRYNNSEESGYFFSIASLDFNNDGYNEVVAGDYEFDKAFLFSTEYSGRINKYDYSLPGYPANAGDYNGDGIDDIFAIYDNSYDNTYITTGGGTLDNNPDIVIYGAYVDLSIGDIDGDGFDDLYTGISYSSENYKALFYFGNNNNVVDTMSFFNSTSLRYESRGDYNGDGNIDLILGWQTLNIIYGNNSRDISINNSIYCPNYEGYHGTTIDLNNDGYDDYIAIYQPSYNYPIVYRLYMGSPMGLTEDNYQVIDAAFFGLPNSSTLDKRGFYSIGDFNNDSYGDFIISNVIDGIQHIMLVFGNSTGSNFDVIEVPLPVEISEYGNFRVGKGDVNGDGISDLIISAQSSYMKEINVFFGGNSNLDTPDITIFSNNEDEYLSSFITADVNGDGLTDILVKVGQFYGDRRMNIYLSTVKNKAPYFKSVKDVPADQGGFVTLTWFKSGFDGGKVTSYQIERSIAPVGGGFAWEVIGSVPASHFNYYSYTAPTLNDQTPENTGNTYFRITALTDNQDVFYRSNILYGHSVDNLAPVAPGGLKAFEEGTEARISWQLNGENDIKNYLVYRSVNEEVNFDTLEVYGAVADSVFTDENPLNRSAYYFVRAADIHGNIGNASSVLLQVTGVNDEDGLPTKYALGQNYPNPFNPTTNITYVIARSGATRQSDGLLVQLKVYDVLGREVAMLVNAKQTPGNYSVQFNASKLGSGIYFYTLRAGNFVQTRKMVLMR